MLFTDEEIKIREEQPFIDKYYVETGYDLIEGTDYEIIGRAKPIDVKQNGQNWCSTYDYYEFNIYDTFEEAVSHHHKRCDLIGLEEDGISEEQVNYFHQYVKEKMNDEQYLEKFGIKKDDDFER